MIEINENKNCMGCTACMNICPKNCITMELDLEGFSYPKVDKDKCIECNLCNKICPMHNEKKHINVLDTFLLKNKDNTIRKKSTSGGVFYELAKYVISKKGIVYGAHYDENEKYLTHIKIDKIEDLSKILKSKYMQSDLKSIFKDIENHLKNGIFILFCGTPCQVSGLSSYLRKQYDNLLLVDFVCHGVPSQYVWKEYLKAIETKENDIVKKIHFRYKDDNWTKCAIKIDFERKSITQDLSKNSYLLNFNDSLFLRPSCYDCKFKGENRFSDITLADAWGVNIYNNDFYDEKGVSCVVINSDYGNEILSNIRDSFEIEKVGFENVIKYNSQYLYSAKVNKNRDNFFRNLDLYGYSYAIKKHGKKSDNKYLFYLKLIFNKIIS